MDLSRARPSIAALPAILLALLSAAPRPAAADTTITDPLTGSTTLATRRNGGEFTVEGWKVTTNSAHKQVGQYLYLLPEGVTSGTLTFEAKGFKFDKYSSRGGETEEREHILGVFDQDEKHDKTADPIGCFSASMTTRTIRARSIRARTGCASTAPPSRSSAIRRPRSPGARPPGISSRSSGHRRWSAGSRTMSFSAASPSCRPRSCRARPRSRSAICMSAPTIALYYITPVNVTYRNVNIVVK